MGTLGNKGLSFVNVRLFLIIKKYNSCNLFTLSLINLSKQHFLCKMNKNSVLNESLVKDLTERLAKAERKISVLTKELSEIKSLLAPHQNNSTSIRSFSTKRPAEEDMNDVISKRFAVYNTHQDVEFTKENGYVVLYTDGACENNGRANAKAGIGVWFGQNHPLNVSEPVKGKATNNTAEIQACTWALTILNQQGVRKVKIKTDSQFVINSMTMWISKWKRNNWKVATGGDVKNREEFINLDKAINLLDDVVWEHVEGHKGIFGNEEADKLARAGARRYVK